MSLTDESTRNMGARARLAFDALEVAIWKRSVEILHDAEILSEKHELTIERSHAILISLLEQRKIAKNLQSQIADGVKAARRIDHRMEESAAVSKAEAAAVTHGRNRFTRSKVAQPIP